MAVITTETTITAEEEISCNQLTTTTTDNTKITILFHPDYEKIVPKLKPEEYEELKSSIAKNGLYHPIIITFFSIILVIIMLILLLLQLLPDISSKT